MTSEVGTVSTSWSHIVSYLNLENPTLLLKTQSADLLGTNALLRRLKLSSKTCSLKTGKWTS
jgi:hypothetical protein